MVYITLYTQCQCIEYRRLLHRVILRIFACMICCKSAALTYRVMSLNSTSVPPPPLSGVRICVHVQGTQRGSRGRVLRALPHASTHTSPPLRIRPHAHPPAIAGRSGLLAVLSPARTAAGQSVHAREETRAEVAVPRSGPCSVQCAERLCGLMHGPDGSAALRAGLSVAWACACYLLKRIQVDGRG